MSNRGGVTRMESAGDVGAADEGNQCIVIAQSPATVRFADVGVEVDGGHVRMPDYRAAPP